MVPFEARLPFQAHDPQGRCHRAAAGGEERADPAGLFCVNFAHLSGAKFADSGVEPLGCLRMVSHPELGLKFSC